MIQRGPGTVISLSLIVAAIFLTCGLPPPIHEELSPFFDEPPMPMAGVTTIAENIVYPGETLLDESEDIVVTINARIDSTGKVTSTDVVRKSGNSDLDKAVAEAIKRTSWKPATYEGRPVPTIVIIPVRFNQGRVTVVYPRPRYDKPPIPIGGYEAIMENLVYPEIAQEAGIEGMVVIQAFVDEEGNVTHTAIQFGLMGTGLAEAAIKAIAKTHFEPATLKGEPVGVWIAIPVGFRLR